MAIALKGASPHRAGRPLRVLFVLIVCGLLALLVYQRGILKAANLNSSDQTHVGAQLGLVHQAAFAPCCLEGFVELCQCCACRTSAELKRFFTFCTCCGYGQRCATGAHLPVLHL